MYGFKVQQSERFRSRFKRYTKKHKKEMEAIRKNLYSTLEMLGELSLPIHQIKFGPLKCEFGNVFRLSPQGGGVGLKPIRLYFSIDESKKILYLLCLGTKTRQSEDINYCKREVKKQGSAING